MNKIEKLEQKISDVNRDVNRIGGELESLLVSSRNKFTALEKKLKAIELTKINREVELEDHNFRVNSDGWKKETNEDGDEYLVGPNNDIWELINCQNQELNGEQLFTWDAAMRETKKAGKRIPTDEEFSEIFKTKDDMPNFALAGYRDTGGSFDDRASNVYFWSSTPSGSNAWLRYLYSGNTTVYRDAYSKAFGFSVRCLKD